MIFKNNNTNIKLSLDVGIEVEEIIDEELDSLLDNAFMKKLILWNDEVNSFENVIISLIEICRHSLQQAEQCTIITHEKGKCQIKSANTIDDLKPYKDALIERGLSVTIE